MNVQEALSKIHAPKGVTSMIAGVMSGDFDPIREQNAAGASLITARAELERVERAQNACTSDWAFWGYEGDRAYWHATVNILEAAELVGADKLPDVAPPKDGVVVMDQCSYIEDFGRRILEAARTIAQDSNR